MPKDQREVRLSLSAALVDQIDREAEAKGIELDTHVNQLLTLMVNSTESERTRIARGV